MPLPDSSFIALFPLQEVIFNKDDGELLSAGVITFYSDVNRTVLKPIYQQEQQPDNTYEFVELANPVTLTSIGSLGNDNGDDIMIYLYPFEGAPTDETRGAIELYYITVDSSSGVRQFTREAWPPNASGGNNPIDTFEGSENAISNPQFVEVLFTPDPTTGSFTYSASGSNMETVIAPGWSLITNGTGTVTVSQVAISDSSVPSNPPYVLDINSTGITGTILRQRLEASPRLFYGSFVSGYFLIEPQDNLAVFATMDYVASAGSPATFRVAEGNATELNVYTAITGTVEITATGSTGSAPTGYVDIDITIPAVRHVRISSVQIVEVENDASSTQFLQESTARQIDHLFHYYKPELIAKPIPSYLVGWDFPLNPAQFATAANRVVAATAIGANKSKYVWDQTIVFQSADSGVGVTGGAAGEIVLTAAATTQMALVQYLDATLARKLLNGRMAVNIAAKASVATTATVSLWYTTDASLPNIASGTNNSIVATMGASGTVATENGTWTEVSRSGLGNATFSIGTSADTSFNDYSFNGWDLDGAAAANTATFFAIVIGTASVTIAGTVSIYSVGLCKGDIATRPAPQSASEVLVDCQYYYQKSFATTVPPAQNAGLANAAFSTQVAPAGSPGAYGPPVRFAVELRVVPTGKVTFFNPSAANGLIRNINTSTDWANTAIANLGIKGFQTTGDTPGGTGAQQPAYVHWVADARLGII